MWPEKESNPDANKRTRNQGSRSCKTQGMLFADLEPVPYDKNIDPPPNACLNCWSLEHKRLVCPQSKMHDYCCNCGRKGLTVEECPRCAKPFQAQRSEFKKWVYAKFFDKDVNPSAGAHQKHQAASKKKDSRCKDDAENWDQYDDSYYQSPEDGKTTTVGHQLNKHDDQDFGWEPSYQTNPTAIAESNELFTYMRDKKIRDQFKSDRINNPEGNLDETRMAEQNFTEEISDNSLNKNQPGNGMGEPLRDFLNLLDAMKHLSVNTQDVVVLQFMSERKKQMKKQEKN